MANLSSDEVLDNVCFHLITSLKELTQNRPVSEFAEGQIISFVECLEIISEWKHFCKFGINDIEKRFPVK